MSIADRIHRWSAVQWTVPVSRFLLIVLIIGMAALQSDAVFPFPTHRWVWGENDHGELGNFSDQDADHPITTSLGLPAGVSLTRMSGGDDSPLAESHSLALDRNGNVWGWGHNPFGQVGNGENSSSPVFGPTEVCASSAQTVPCTEFLSNITAIDAGGRHSLAIDIFSNVWAWGDNTYSQLGSNVGLGSVLPVRNNALFAQLHQLPGPPSVKSVAAGATHSLALDSRGVVWGWGANEGGELGLGFNSLPQLFALALDTFPDGTVITVIAAGTYHNLAIDNAGNAWSWGFNHNGQLGTGSFDESHNVPEKLIHFPDNTRIIAVAAGSAFSLALDSGGNVWAFGANVVGQLGNGQNIEQHGPTRVTFPNGTPRIVAIAAGGAHGLALDATHNVWAWGNNGNGQLGNRATGVNSNVPVRVDFPVGINVTGIAAGHNHNLALESEGFVVDLEGVLEFDTVAARVRLLGQGFDPDKLVNVETTSTNLNPAGNKQLVTNKLTDSAGNKLVLTLTQQEIGGDGVALQVVSLQYNDGVVITPPDNLNEIHSKTDALGKITLLQQHVQIRLQRGVTNITAHYVEARNQTDIDVTSPGGPPQHFTVAGVVPVQMGTINGNLTFSDGTHIWP